MLTLLTVVSGLKQQMFCISTSNDDAVLTT